MSFADARLGRQAHHPPPALTLWGQVALPLSRAHEICGRARRTLALHVAAQAGGPVLWIAPGHGRDDLNPDGVLALTPPQEMLFARASRPEDMLWAAEEALRSGAVPVVVADLPGPPGMVPVRRLHLAAEAGTAEGRCRPLALLLTPEEGGAPGVESRWRLEPGHVPGRACWRLERLRARMAPPRGWWLEEGGLRPGGASSGPAGAEAGAGAG